MVTVIQCLDQRRLETLVLLLEQQDLLVFWREPAVDREECTGAWRVVTVRGVVASCVAASVGSRGLRRAGCVSEGSARWGDSCLSEQASPQFPSGKSDILGKLPKLNLY